MTYWMCHIVCLEQQRVASRETDVSRNSLGGSRTASSLGESRMFQRYTAFSRYFYVLCYIGWACSRDARRRSGMLLTFHLYTFWWGSDFMVSAYRKLLGLRKSRAIAPLQSRAVAPPGAPKSGSFQQTVTKKLVEMEQSQQNLVTEKIGVIKC